MTRMAMFAAMLLAVFDFTRAAQSDFYLREEIPLPKGEVMEIGSIALMPGKRIAVATRHGEIWICEGAYADDLSGVKWHKFAEGLHEPFGMFWKDGSFWLTQRPEFTRVSDTDGDGLADRYETICDSWGISGDFHEYAFGSTPDKEGNVWIAFCLTGSFTSECPWRGWCVRVTPEGRMIPTCSGIRSPGGIGFNAEGETFILDNQGTWNGSSALKWLKPGSFQGDPHGNKWHDLAGLPPPPEPRDGSRILEERLRFPNLVPPAVILPHGRVGQSPTGFVCDTRAAFGPWKDQLYVGEHTHAQVQRICLEKVNGIYQGAVFHFLDGFASGVVPVKLDDEKGYLFTGGTSRGWPSRGFKPFSLERVRPTGRIPFEIQTVSATPEGFEIRFTKSVDPAAGDPAKWSVDAWTYIYQSKYGSPEVDQAHPVVEAVQVAADGMSAKLMVKGRVRGHVHHIAVKGVKSAKGEELWHSEAWYTLNEIPVP